MFSSCSSYFFLQISSVLNSTCAKHLRSENGSFGSSTLNSVYFFANQSMTARELQRTARLLQRRIILRRSPVPNAEAHCCFFSKKAVCQKKPVPNPFLFKKSILVFGHTDLLFIFLLLIFKKDACWESNLWFLVPTFAAIQLKDSIRDNHLKCFNMPFI